MPLTRDFRVTILARARRDVRFCQSLLTESINDYLAGETAVGRSILRDLVNATIGFEALASRDRQAEQEPAPDAWSWRQPEQRELLRDRVRHFSDSMHVKLRVTVRAA